MKIFQPTYVRDIGLGWSNPGAKERRKSAVWWVEARVNGKRLRASTGLRDQAAAFVKAGQIVREAELKAAGIETHTGTTAETPACLFDKYRVTMADRGLAPKHVATTIARCETLAEGCASIADLTPVRVRLALERLRGASAKTINGYRTALLGFFSWLVREGQWASNPVETVAPARVVSDGPVRRALTPDEQVRLLHGALLTPEELRCYEVALNTGLRRAELAAITYDEVLVLTDHPRRYGVLVRGKTAKNRKDRVLPLPDGYAVKTPLHKTQRFLRVPSIARFRRHLHEAGIPEVTPEGRIDFHALRVTFGTNLARAGVPLTLAQRLMRHSSPDLTSNIYTRLGVNDEMAAVDRASAATAG